MKHNIIKDKTISFAVEIIKFSKILNHSKEFVIANQLKRSGTSIGAQIWEAEHAQSNADFIHKFSLAQKEANETIYWLEILRRINVIHGQMISKLKFLAEEIVKIITAIIKKCKAKG
jgi:four helix bundle protein